MNFIEVDGSIDGVFDDVRVIVETQVTQHLYAGGQRGDGVGLLCAHQCLDHKEFVNLVYLIRGLSNKT